MIPAENGFIRSATFTTTVLFALRAMGRDAEGGIPYGVQINQPPLFPSLEGCRVAAGRWGAARRRRGLAHTPSNNQTAISPSPRLHHAKYGISTTGTSTFSGG